MGVFWGPGLVGGARRRRPGSEQRVRSASRPPRPPSHSLCFFELLRRPRCVSSGAHPRSASSGELGSRPPGADSLPGRRERPGFGPGAPLCRGGRTGASRRQPTLRGDPLPPALQAPLIFPHADLLPGPTQGTGTSLAVLLEFTAPLEFLGTHFFGLCCKALARLAFKVKAFGTGIYFYVAAIRQLNEQAQIDQSSFSRF